ncbi:MAG TPA: UbiD family decarboxylase [Chloroflexota bacterium]|jgi:UbiD family decarboxylase|nr:UbiD family decarboxylase [Chloroflexota bacterium]
MTIVQPGAVARGYPDLHEHLAALDAAGLLVRVTRPINKDTELHPLVRWQFRGGIPEPQRKAFLFEHVVDGRGHRYPMPVAVGVLAANRQIYSLGMGCPAEEIGRRWQAARQHPIPPRLVASGPVHEVVRTGAQLDEPYGGVDGLPVPISTPGFDIAPFLTCANWVTRDPDTGVQNIGNYRAHIKGPRRVGLNASLELSPGIYQHWLKARARGEPLPAAIVIGGPPVVAFAAVQKLPYDLDELAVAGGLVGSPINMVRCQTVDLLVPAESEIVIEGYIDTRWLEPEAPFGESHGYVNLQEYNPFLEVTAICHRRDAILTSLISQVTPSESSLIKLVGYEPLLTSYLRDQLGIRSVVRVGLHEPLTNIRKVVVVQMRPAPEAEVWHALTAAASFQRSVGKLVIAVDEDIDPHNPDAVLWALSYRMSPHRDVQILRGRDPGHGPKPRGGDAAELDSALLINAMLKTPFPPVSLPKREYMERARALWEELGLPPLRPEAPWYGYSLGDWHPHLDELARRAAAGDYWAIGAELARRRRDDVAPNTPVRPEDL